MGEGILKKKSIAFSYRYIYSNPPVTHLTAGSAGVVGEEEYSGGQCSHLFRRQSAYTTIEHVSE